MSNYDLDVRNRSVTKDDTGPVVFQFVGPNPQGDLLPDLPVGWSQQVDGITRTTPKVEGLWSTAVHRAIGRVSSRLFELEGEIGLRVRRHQEMFLAANTLGYTKDGRVWGRGWQHFLNQHLRAFLLTDNGAFTEVVYQKGRVIGFIHLDPSRCYRTDDALKPVVYLDDNGVEHEMPAHTVFWISDYFGSSDYGIGDGECAARSVYDQVRVWHVAQRYIYEKGSGRRPQKVGFVGGVTPKHLQQIVANAQTQADVQGVISYLGALISAVPSEQPLSKVEFDLVGLPDWFDRRKEWEITVARYAARLGLDAADLAPQRIGGYGSGGMARVYEEKAKENVLAGWQRAFLHYANFYLVDSVTRFVWSDEGDMGALAEQARAASTWAETLSTLVESFILTPDQALQIAVDNSKATGVPQDFLMRDTTGDASLTDEDRGSSLDPETPAKPQNASFVKTDEDEQPATVQESKIKPKKQKSAAELANLRLSFADVVRGLVTDLTQGIMDKERFTFQLRENLAFLAPLLFRAGAGLERDTPLTTSEQNTVEVAMQFYSERVPHFADFIEGQPDANKIEDRAKLWVLKLAEFYWLGVMLDRRDPHLEWVLGQSEHCKDCYKLSGQVHRASEWRVAGLWPQNRHLACNGFCRCAFRRVDGPASGNFLSGAV